MTTTTDIRPLHHQASTFIAKNRTGSGLRIFSKGEQIYRPGDAADYIYFIAEGKVRISTRTGSGQEMTQAIFTGGDLFGEQAMTGEEIRSQYAVALEDTALRVLSIRDMLLLLNGRNDLTALLMQRISSN